MQPHIDLSREDAAALYTSSIERERVARQAMESLPPGSLERARAWQTWSEAIVCTNRAWRSLRDSSAGASRKSLATSPPERPHASA